MKKKKQAFRFFKKTGVEWKQHGYINCITSFVVEGACCCIVAKEGAAASPRRPF